MIYAPLLVLSMPFKWLSDTNKTSLLQKCIYKNIYNYNL